MSPSKSEPGKNQDKDPKKGKVISKEPIDVLEIRRDMLKKVLIPWMGIGIAILIGVLWLLNVIISSIINAIIGLAAFCLCIAFMIYGYHQRSQLHDLKPVTIYENGIDAPQLDGRTKFFSFKRVAKYPKEDIDGYEIIVLEIEKSEYPLVIWPKMAKHLAKKTS